MYIKLKKSLLKCALIAMVFPLFSAIGQSETASYTLVGEVKGINETKIELVQGFSVVNKPLGTTTIENGKFTFTGEISSAKPATLLIKSGDEIAYFSEFFLEPGTTNVVLDAEAEFFAADALGKCLLVEAKGSPATDTFLKYQAEILKFYDTKKGKKIVEYGNKYYSDPDNVDESEPWVEEFYELEDHYVLKVEDIRHKFAKQHPSSVVALYVMKDLGFGFDESALGEEGLKKMFENFDKSLADEPPYKAFEEKLKALKSLVDGAQAPEFTLKNPQGDEVSLASFQGKYVLIDFWTFWCGPCIAEFPHLEKLRKKYEKEGFEILAVHGDIDNQEWLKAVKEHEPSWPQVQMQDPDTTPNGISILDTYNITAFPTGFLLDREGKIIGKDLYADVLDAKLKEVFGK